MTTKNPADLGGVGNAVEQVIGGDGLVGGELMERVIVGGDLSKLTAEERVRFYAAVCRSVGLNPLTQPFQFLYLQNKMTLYARKEATEQLRELHGVSVTKLDTNLIDDGEDRIYTVTAYGTNAKGRVDSAVGAIALGAAHGEAKANLIMKCETKAKRRLTLSLCGLGVLDESEIEVPPGAVTATQTFDLGHARIASPDEAAPTAEVRTLFPSPEEDRAKLVGRARIGVARMNKDKAAALKVQHFGSAEAKYEEVDLSALVAFVAAVEVPLAG